MHCVIVEYSSSFYAKILDLIPNIKTTNDKKFAEHTLIISRKLLNMDPQITSDQLCPDR